MDQWHIACGKVKKGPFTFAQLQALAWEGSLVSTTMLHQAGAATWVQAGDIPTLFPCALLVPSSAPEASPLPCGPAAAAKKAPAQLSWKWLAIVASGLGGLGLLVGVVVAVWVFTGWLVQQPNPALAQNELQQVPPKGTPQAEVKKPAQEEKNPPPMLASEEKSAPNANKPANKKSGNDPTPSDKSGAAKAAKNPALAAQGTAGGKEKPDKGEKHDDAYSSTDVTLLKLASTPYSHNLDYISPDKAVQHADLLIRESTKPLADSRSKLAGLIIVKDTLFASVSALSNEQAAMLKSFGTVYYSAAFLSVVESMPNGAPLSYPQMRKTIAGRGFEGWIDEYRNKQVAQSAAHIAWIQLHANLAKLVEESYRPKLGVADLSGQGILTFAVNPNSRWSVAVTYRGAKPLTDVILVGRLKTTGGSAVLTPNQKFILRANEASGSGDKVKDIEKLFANQNYLDTMPRVNFVFIPSLNPGDVVRFDLGDADDKATLGASISLYSRQGSIRDHELFLSQALRKGRASIAATVIKLGMTKSEATIQLGEVQPFDEKTWAWGPKPNIANGPPNAEYVSWGGRDPAILPRLVVGFLAERVVFVELVAQPTLTELQKELKVGMTEEDVQQTLKKQGYYALNLKDPLGPKSYRGEWPDGPRPKFAGIPADTKFYSLYQGAPTLVIGFSQNRVVLVTLVERKK